MDLRALTSTAGAILVALAASCGPASGPPGGDRGTARAPGSVRYADHVSAGDVAPPADSLVNPLDGNPDAVRQGERLFSSMNCDGCHGEGGLGFAGPSLVDGRWRYGGGDGSLYQSIFYGRPRGMPAYGGLLSEATIWQLVAYLRSQPVPAQVPTVSWP